MIDPREVVGAGYHFTVEAVPRGGGAAGRSERCHLRILLLLATITIMGLCDLFFTLTYMQSVGMVEMNPFARAAVTVGSVPGLVAFKIILMSVSSVTLYLARGNRLAEPIAWACAIGLMGLMVHWLNYNRSVAEFTNEMAILAMDGPGSGSAFVRLGS